MCSCLYMCAHLCVWVQAQAWYSTFIEIRRQHRVAVLLSLLFLEIKDSFLLLQMHTIMLAFSCAFWGFQTQVLILEKASAHSGQAISPTATWIYFKSFKKYWNINTFDLHVCTRDKNIWQKDILPFHIYTEKKCSGFSESRILVPRWFLTLGASLPNLQFSHLWN